MITKQQYVTLLEVLAGFKAGRYTSKMVLEAIADIDLDELLLVANASQVKAETSTPKRSIRQIHHEQCHNDVIAEERRDGIDHADQGSGPVEVQFRTRCSKCRKPIEAGDTVIFRTVTNGA